jgi:hypothetical protein
LDRTLHYRERALCLQSLATIESRVHTLREETRELQHYQVADSIAAMRTFHGSVAQNRATY